VGGLGAVAVVAVVAQLSTGCDDTPAPASSMPTSTALPASATPIQIGPQSAVALPTDPNPLELPPRALELSAGARVFAPTAATLRGAKPGSTLALRATTVQARSGDAVLLDGRDGPPYEVHTGYVIPILGVARPSLGAPVVAEWAGALHHGVVRRYAKDRIVVRFTDTVDRAERQVSPQQLIAQVDGFHPGNHAVARSDEGWDHVLLVAPVERAPKAWLCLGYGGAASVVPEEALRPIPVMYAPKVGALVWVAHLGRMRPGVVKEVDPPGLATERVERVGRPIQVGWGSLMAPLADAPPPR
jgi:hypothetical protein